MADYIWKSVVACCARNGLRLDSELPPIFQSLVFHELEKKNEIANLLVLNLNFFYVPVLFIFF